jgi:glycosyltransferase involved in cell wall biosynthesis
MRLLVYAGGFAPVGGIETFLHGLGLGLRSRGIQPQLLCWGTRSHLLEDLESAGVPVRRQAWRWGCRWGWPNWLLLPAGKAAIRQADVVLFGKLFDERVHRRLMRVKIANGRPPFVLVTPYRPAEMWADCPPCDEVLNSFEAIVVQANCFGEDLHRLGYRGQIHVLPYLPPACAAPSPLPPYPPLRIGFLGRLVRDKNLPYLLRAASVISRQVDVVVHLFGDGAEKSSLAAVAGELGLARRVYFHGAIPREQVSAAADSCHMFAFASVTEGQAVAALEILSRGRPIVATPVGVFPELLSEPAFGVLGPLNSADEFARKLLALGGSVLEGAVTPEQIQAAYSQHFSRERVLEEYCKLFTELAG